MLKLYLFYYGNTCVITMRVYFFFSSFLFIIQYAFIYTHIVDIGYGALGLYAIQFLEHFIP